MLDWKTEGAGLFAPLSLLAMAAFAWFFHYVYRNRNRPVIRARLDQIRPYMNVKNDWIFLLTALVCDLLLVTLLWAAVHEWLLN